MSQWLSGEKPPQKEFLDIFVARWVGISYFDFQELPASEKMSARAYYTVFRNEVKQRWMSKITSETDGAGALYYLTHVLSDFMIGP